MKKIDYLIGVSMIESSISCNIDSYTIVILNTNTGCFELCISKKFNEKDMIQDITSITKKYINCKILFENSNILLVRFLEKNFEDYLYESETAMFGVKYKGFRLSANLVNSFELKKESVAMDRLLNSLQYLHNKSLGQL